jgi:hypothetical protein
MLSSEKNFAELQTTEYVEMLGSMPSAVCNGSDTKV